MLACHYCVPGRSEGKRLTADTSAHVHAVESSADISSAICSVPVAGTLQTGIAIPGLGSVADSYKQLC